MAVVQFGLATTRFFDLRAASALISGTTSGTVGSYRNADELSITSGPSSAVILSTHSSAKSPETARKTTSHARAASRVNSSIIFAPKGVAIGFPDERADANSLRSLTGNSRVPSTSIISFPTAPVTPTTAIVSGFDTMSGAAVRGAAVATAAGAAERW
jgi:hypothetical protein